MDRSMDSIGSCSLDVDADSSDISDTSGSLNFTTPVSVKDITRDFTANIRERCPVRAVQGIRDNVKHMSSDQDQMFMVLTQPTIDNVTKSCTSSLIKADVTPEKKPSYLNLACCVNGYSNLTTYDSKIRQDISKSREVSPIRPSSSSIQYCKKNNSLAPPILLTMPNTNMNNKNTLSNTMLPAGAQMCSYDNNTNKYNSNEHDECRSTSVIQQRVERLYGPGALAQVFYSPKKMRACHSARSINIDKGIESSISTELTQTSNHLKSNNECDFKKKLSNSAPNSARNIALTNTDNKQSENVDYLADDLPVLRHLSHQFRAQLAMVTPKKYTTRSGFIKTANDNKTAVVVSHMSTMEKLITDEVDHKNVPLSGSVECSLNVINSENNNCSLFTDKVCKDDQFKIQQSLLNRDHIHTCATLKNDEVPKDGNHFLMLLQKEKNRILGLANVAESYIDVLSTNNLEINEDTLGFLRSASGKARLLVSQKMKQFEGLCNKNLNRSQDDKFPTTVDDLEGFWDMLNLQINHIDSIFEEIEKLKNNNWKEEQFNVFQTNVPTKLPKLSKTGNIKTKPTTNGNKSVSIGMSAATIKRESQRKQLLEIKRKQKLAMTSNTKNIDNVTNIGSSDTFNNANTN